MEYRVQERCYVCQVPLGESSNVLYVEGYWMHYKCVFRKSVERATGKEVTDNAPI